MIDTLLITILIEGSIIIVYCKRSGKPLLPILITSIGANVLTQSVLWVALTIFFQQYIVTLVIAETLIWFMEGFLLSMPSQNHLAFRDALYISLLMNLVSFGVGWLLPV